MKLRVSDIVIPLLIVATALLGSAFTATGMSWYRTIDVPSWTPGGGVISMVWTAIFILCGLSGILFWRKSPRDNNFKYFIYFGLINLLLNAGWSFLFFNQQSIVFALVEMAALFATIIGLMIIMGRVSIVTAALLSPYALWVLFATYLTYTILDLNP